MKIFSQTKISGCNFVDGAAAKVRATLNFGMKKTE